MNNQYYSNWIELLQSRTLHQPSQTAFIFLQDDEISKETLTYQQLDIKARTIAAYLQERFTTGERALLLYPSGLDYVVAFFGCLYAGIIAVPLYPPRNNRNRSRIESVLTDSQATIALTTSSVLSKVGEQGDSNHNLSNLHWLATDLLDNELGNQWQNLLVKGDTIAYLQYTSGSTATPKGVIITHENALHNSADMSISWETRLDSVLVSWLPHFHDFGQVYGILQPIYKGFPCILMPPTCFVQQPIRWLKAISEYRGTHSGGPNFAYKHCLQKTTPEQRANLDLSSWCVAVNGAEPIRHKTLEEFYKTFAPYGFRWNTFCPGYGLAEATLKVTAARIGETPIFGAFEANSLSLHRIVETVESEPDAKILVGCGRTLLETKVAIVEPQSLKQCPSGSVGEIWVSGPSVTKGYWNRPEETQRTFQSYLADTGEGPFLRTGDLGFVKDSELFVTGRIKDLIIIRGTNHYPQDIELTAEQSHPSLRSDYCAAFAIEEKDQERLVIACEVERTYLKKLNTDEVIRAIRQAVSEAHELEVYMVLLLKTGSIPKTSSGKIQRQACRNQILNQQLEVVAQWQNPLVNEPSSLENPYGTSKNLQKKNLTKEQIQDWIVFWSAKHMGLDITQIDPFQPLSRYSLSSLQMMELSSELEALLGYSIDPDWLWDSSSIERLADQLYNSRNACLTIPAL